MKLESFIQHIQLRRQALLGLLPSASPLAGQLRAMAPSLALAQAVLEKAGLPQHPPQLVVLGPTQAGKSTVVNLILGQPAAGISPLAGFTIHPQGFLHQVEAAENAWLDEYFSPYQRLPVSQLPRDRCDCYATETLSHAVPSLPGCMVWDTPDFDSLRACNYRQGMLKTAALADVLVVVISKDKYADQAVWDMLVLLEPLALPMLVCLNKVPAANQPTLLKSWQEKWRGHRSDPPPPVIVLPYQPDSRQLGREAGSLLHVLAPLFKQGLRRRKQYSATAKRLIRCHWSEWTAPIRAELEAAKRWQWLVKEALEQALDIYRYDFLDHPMAYETLQRALGELLILLEIPGLARPMSVFRKVITWPLRAALRKKPASRDEETGELLILRRSVEHALLQLQQALAEEQQQKQTPLAHWWQEMGTHYRELLPGIQQRFHQDTDSYYQEFQPQVEEAAHSLYRRLREMPVTLNGLRAARASADAAGLALLLQTGGIGPHDFVLAPAMLSLTSWLSESALGKYLDRVAADLKSRQLEAVEALIHERLESALLDLPRRIDPRLRFDVSSQTLEAVEQQLKERRHGLQLF